jgi:putative membrane protein
VSVATLPYCGAAPEPGVLLTRFNWDPILIVALTAAVLLHWLAIRGSHAAAGRRTALMLAGWAIASAAFISPLCALSVALFSARVTQHMVLILMAAPLISLGLPPSKRRHYRWRLWLNTGIFGASLWYWHMPAPYDATFSSPSLYWAMHVTLFGSSILLWRDLLDHPPRETAHALTAALFTFIHMGLLGAVLAFAARPLFAWHLTTTQVWGLTPLQDQELGGAVMWVPGIALLLWTATRSISRTWGSLERIHPA